MSTLDELTPREDIVERVRALWRELAGAPGAFRADGVLVVASDRHRLSPQGWVGVVTVGASAVVACPEAVFGPIAAAVGASDPDRLTDPEAVTSILDVDGTLGPAELFSGVPAAAEGARLVGPLDVADDLVAAVLADTAKAEHDESAIESTSSGLDVALTADGRPAALCGWRVWPCDIAHVGCLTARSHRRTGAGELVARAALRRAAADGLLPMWRAAHWNGASIALARRLGLAHVGRQFSFRLA